MRTEDEKMQATGYRKNFNMAWVAGAGLALILAGEHGVQALVQARELAEALEVLRPHQPLVALLDGSRAGRA